MKFSFILIFIFTVVVMGVWASDDEGGDGESNETNDSSSNTTSTSDSNSSTSGNDSSTNNSGDSSNNSTSGSTNNNKNSTASSNTNNYSTNNNNSTVSSDNINTSSSNLGEIDSKSGLSIGTLQMLSRLSPCKRQLLLNYRRLLRSPTIRLQFYRDLYQRYQSEHVATGCGDGGDEKVKLGFRERAVLLGDPFFRARVKKLMRGRQPVGVAINGPVRYSNDLVMDNTQPPQKVLTISKQY